MSKPKVSIIGAGSAGLLAAKKLAEKAEITIYDLGKSVKDRICPERKTGTCANCSLCSKTHGAGGAGLMSDGKLLFDTRVGNNLGEIIGSQKNQRLVEEMINFFESYGINQVTKKTKEVEELEIKALQNEIDFIYPKQTHIGSDKLPDFIKKVQKNLESKGVKFEYGKKINHLDELKYDFLVLAPGRVGVATGWMENILKENNLEYSYRAVDIGVRVEVPHQIADPITNISRDMKFYIRTKCNDDIVRTFCTCPKGYVGREKYDGFNIVNGEASEGIDNHSGNTNFAILVTLPLTAPLANPNKAARLVAEAFHEYGGGKIMAQRLGDIKKRPAGRSKESKQNNYVLHPTLNDVTWGDLRLPLTGRYCEDILEMIDRLNSIMPGIASSQTILYGPEIKFHGLKIKTDEYLHAGKNIYVAGDGAGVSRGIVGAACSGLLTAEGILKKIS